MEGRHSVEKSSLEGLISHDCDFLKAEPKRDGTFKQLSMTSGASSLDSTDSTGTLSRSFTVSNSDRSLSSTSQRDFDGLKQQCEKAMHELQLLRKQHSETIRRYDQAMKELEYHRGQHRTAISQLDAASQESSALRSKCGELLSENQRLEREARNLQTFLEEHRKEVMELRRQQQETLSAESSGAGVEVALNQRYIAALRKYEAVKDDHDSLRKRCDDLIASHAAAVNKLELAQEEVARVKKQCEEMAQERNVAVRERNGLKQQCTAAIRQWDIALREKNEYREALAKVQQQHEEAVKEVNLAMAVRMKTTKEMKRLTEERNAAMQEYSLIMSERDTVHKEIEKLTEDVGRAASKVEQLQSENKTLVEEKKTLSYQMETLRREISSALHDRDKALKECNDLRERFGEFTAQEESGRDGLLKNRLDYDLYNRERDNLRKEQAEVSTSTRDIYGKSQKERMDNLDQANQEIDRLQKQVEKLQAELQEATQEAEVSKRRRDWAFSERDKIVLERESIRTLCDRLRKERDRAVSDLAEALRDSDDIKKQRNEASKELKELKEKMEVQAERESRSKRLHHAVNESHDHGRESVLESDLSEWETETLDIDLSGLSPEVEELGFELVGGRDDPHYPNDSHVYVSSVAEGSIADGKLKPNDCIVSVNGLDCSQANRRAVMEAIRSGCCLGQAGVAVRRRRVGARCLYTTQLQIPSSKDHGLMLETGVYISKITPGSLAAKEGNLAVGDRVLSINGKILDGAQGGSDAAAALEEPGDVLTITALKGMSGGTAMSSPPSSLPPPPPLGPPTSSQALRHNIRSSSGDPHSLSVTPDSGHLSLGSVSPGGASVVVGNSPSYGVIEDGCSVVSGPSSGRSVQTSDEVALAFSTRGQSRVHSDAKHQGSGISDSGPYKVGKMGAGTGGAWEMIREKIEMVRGRRGGKERASDDPVPRPTAAPPPSPGLLGDPEQDDAIAELDSVIDSYRRNQGGDGVKTVAKRSKRREKEEALEKNGGTWPKCRGGGPGIAHANGTILHPRRTKERLPLSAILGNTPRYPPEGDCTSRRRRGDSKDGNSPSGAGPLSHTPFKSLFAVATGLPPSPRGAGSQQPDDGTIDFSVKSGNIGREVLEYYVRKKGGGGSRSGVGALSSEGGSESPSHGWAHSRPHSGRPLSSPPHPHPYPTEPPPFLPPAPHPHHPHPHHGPHASSPLLRSPRHSSSPSPLLLPPAPPPGETSHSEARSHCFEPPYARQSFHHSHSPSADLHYHHPTHLHPPPTHHQHTHHQPQIQAPQQLTGTGPRHQQQQQQQQPKGYPMLSVHTHQIYRGNDDIITLPYHPYEGGTFPWKKENQRIRIPSNQSVTSKSSTGKVSTGSMERSSERSSPMPTFHVEVLNRGRRGGTHPGNRNSLPADYGWAKKRDVFCRPAPGEPRTVHIDKSVEPLGIQISCLESGGVFVSTVSEHSLASQVGLQVGDQLLEVCGINMRSATYQLAANVLRQCGNSITMLVQYSPDKYQELEGSGSSSGADEEEEDKEDDGSAGERVLCHSGQASGRRRSPSGSPTPRNSPRPLRQSNLQEERCRRGVTPSMGDSTPDGGPMPLASLSGADEDDDGLLTGVGTLERQRASRGGPRHLTSGSKDPDKSPQDPRFVFLETKKSSNLGISLVGGNAVGIFIHGVQPESPAHKAGLRTGDQILEYNGTDLRRATAEEAAYELAKPADKVTMLAQYNIERYDEIKDKPGDSFYVRALFERMGNVGCGDWDGMGGGSEVGNIASMPSGAGNPSGGCNHPVQLNFRKDDVLYVDNTMFNGVPGHWRAWLVDEDGRRTQCGVIPSKYKIEEELLLRRSQGDLEGDRRGSTSARRSFFRRKKQHHQHQRSSSRSGGPVTSSAGSTPESCTRELASFSSTSLGWWFSDSNTLDEPQAAPLLSYRRVRRLDHPAFRPVLIMGPLSECIVERLLGDFPGVFSRCEPEILPPHVSVSTVEIGMAEGLFVDYRRRGPSHLEVTTVSAVKEICDKNSHCVLDVSVSSVERLHRHRIYPIVLLVKFKSTKQIREVKDTRCFPTEKVSAKAAKEMYEHSLKLETEYKHLISAVIPGGANVVYMCTQIKCSVDLEQNKTLWVPCPSSGGLGGNPM
ncbi:disks large homolog 5 isoform X2 [Hetaerina americana]|uniref:disks large homolog 5 isoform X2 n=1 Tax=Hetaerina americana TaxID=62018 RepID=UPI003A7F52AA